ncbi:DUF4865 family protein [Photobacterium kishitanii]|uniref:DUF4865 domain-containing protein n=1 Tax=Photobacterium kishitanii TaxID=318456 RepID=A0A2T3KK18_9GAMM|nr:DUF4865 family protein [Photobacterium kishitanii]PSU99800.1 DUF4865 domain-containing protein [Photobacterium kishitanii]
MIAMQYKIVLPSDYPMESIEKRIKEKGHLLDGFPGLIFKAYLYSRKDAKSYENPVNSYAPFYVWRDHHAMMSFLQSDGFKALCGQFGRPKVETWFVDGELTVPDSQHSLACIHNKVGQYRDVHGINYSSWEMLGVTWFSNSEEMNDWDGEVYSVGYVAYGKKLFS